VVCRPGEFTLACWTWNAELELQIVWPFGFVTRTATV
jgi:hypothetical protein